MNFYEIVKPHYVLVKGETLKDVVELYQDRFNASPKDISPVSKEYAKTLFTIGLDSEGRFIKNEEIVHFLEERECAFAPIDSILILPSEERG